MSTPMTRGMLCLPLLVGSVVCSWFVRGSRSAALPLLVPRIRADHPHHPATADDLALLAHPSNAAPDLHRSPSFFLRSPRMMIRPLVRSYGDISTVILSPGRIRM